MVLERGRQGFWPQSGSLDSVYRLGVNSRGSWSASAWRVAMAVHRPELGDWKHVSPVVFLMGGQSRGYFYCY